jgi:hypothetical protein
MCKLHNYVNFKAWSNCISSRSTKYRNALSIVCTFKKLLKEVYDKFVLKQEEILRVCRILSGWESKFLNLSRQWSKVYPIAMLMFPL